MDVTSAAVNFWPSGAVGFYMGKELILGLDY